MRLVEVVMLMGAHCVSPVEHSQTMTEAAKVQCAVVIEKDTDSGTMTVTPQAAASDPQVAAAVARFSAAPVDPLNGNSRTIVPAWAPAGSPTTEIKPPDVKAVAVPEPIAPPIDAASPVEAAAPPAPEVAAKPPAAPQATPVPKSERKVAMLMPPPQKPATAKADTRKKQAAKVQPAATPKSGACKSGATAKWYTTGDGRKKYRCVKPGGDAAPEQLY